MANFHALSSTSGERNDAHEGQIPRIHQRSAKGRRRKAAAELRRIEEERRGQWLLSFEDEEDECSSSAQPPSRRRCRRKRRNNRHMTDSEHYNIYENNNYNDSITDNEEDFEIALAVSLSLVENAHESEASLVNTHEYGRLDLSFERLSLLENVKCATSESVITTLPVFQCQGHENETCAICLSDYQESEEIMCLPCGHRFHHHCAKQWLVSYSKLCPICKFELQPL